MISPFGMFWSSLMNPTNLDDLLSKINNIDELLEEDNIINSIKQQGNKLAIHLKRRPEQFKSLVNYVYEEQKGDNQKQQFKFPMLVSDIFGIENPKIINLFFEKFEHLSEVQDLEASQSDSNSQKQDGSNNEELNDENKQEKNDEEEKQELQEEEEKQDQLEEEDQKENNDLEEKKEQKSEYQDGKQILEYLLSYLYIDQTNDDLNQTLAGYFAKTIISILNVKGLIFIDYIYEEKFDVFDQLLNKIGCKSLADLFWKLLIIETNDREENSSHYVEKRKIILDKMIQLYEKTEDFEIQCSITQILCDIFEKNTLIDSSNELIQHILSNENFEIIRAKIQDPSQFISHNACKIFNNIINYIANQSQEQKMEDDVVIDSSDITSLIQEKIQIVLLDAIKLLMEKTQKSGEYQTLYGVQTQNFGNGHLKLLELVLNSFKIQLANEIFNQENLSHIMNFIVQYPYNNFVQIMVEKILSNIIQGEQWALKELLFSKCQLTQFIITHMENQYLELEDKEKKIRQGYIAQLVQLSNKIIAYSQKNIEITDFIPLNEWEMFQENILNKHNQDNATDIGYMKGQEEDERQKASEAQDIDSIFKKYSHLFEDKDQNQDQWEDQEDEDIDVQEMDQDQVNDEKPKLEDVTDDVEQIQEVKEDYLQHNFWKTRTFDLDDIINDYS